jgi:F-type H+-transporting ATPase subunit delta
VSAMSEVLGELQTAARDLVRQAAEKVDLKGVKEALEAIEHAGAAERLEAEVTSAVPLTDAERAALEGRLRAKNGQDLPVHYRVDPAILGGLIVRLGDRMVDGSLATRLNQLRQNIAG